MRYLPDVIKKILAFHQFPDEARPVLEDILDSAYFSSPENMSLWWMEAGDILNSYLGFPDTLWKLRMQEIFTGIQRVVWF